MVPSRPRVQPVQSPASGKRCRRSQDEYRFLLVNQTNTLVTCISHGYNDGILNHRCAWEDGYGSRLHLRGYKPGLLRFLSFNIFNHLRHRRLIRCYISYFRLFPGTPGIAISFILRSRWSKEPPLPSWLWLARHWLVSSTSAVVVVVVPDTGRSPNTGRSPIPSSITRNPITRSRITRSRTTRSRTTRSLLTRRPHSPPSQLCLSPSLTSSPRRLPSRPLIAQVSYPLCASQ